MVVAKSQLTVIENDEDIDVEDEGDIDLTISQRNQPSPPSALPFTTDQPSSSKTSMLGELQPPSNLFIPNMNRTTSTKRKAADNPIAAALQGTNQLISNMSQPESEDELFGRSVGLHLSKLQPIQRAFAKLKIQEVLFNVEFGNVKN